jgi:hypothetical protein
MTVEYLAPGVYVEELAISPRPIEGVSTSTASYAGVYLVETNVAPKPIDGVSTSTEPWIGHATLVELARLATLSPEWTDHNTHDPGIVLVDLLAWLAENLLYRARPLPREALPAAARLACASLALVAGHKVGAHRAAMSVVAVVGAGVVQGLEVSVDDGPRVSIAAGTAIGGLGQEVSPDHDDSRERHRAVRRKKEP